MSKSALAAAKLRRWREDPVTFVTECLGVQEIDDWQIDVLRAFPHKNRIAMKACKGVGKTATEVWLAWNFLVTRPYPKIAATSISGANLADGMWSEMSKWQQRSEYLKSAFTWTKTRVCSTQEPENWFMSARTWPNGADPSQQANVLAGLHADYIMFILDESGGIPDAVMAAAEAALSSGIEAKLIQAGNPTHLTGPLYRACTTERHLWYLVTITGDPDDPKRSSRQDITWAREQIEKYGRDNPYVIVNVFGQFPPASMNTLLGPDDVEAAMKRHYREDEYEFAQKRLGIDVSRFGDDKTIIFPRQGIVAFKPTEMRNARTNEIAARVAQAKARWLSEVEMVDGTGGYGAGVIDSLIQAGHTPLEVNFAGKAIDSRYFNKRAEMAFSLAEWVKRGGALPNDPDLARELTTPTYSFQNGKFRLEEKDQIKERLGHSCDKMDALMLTFALPEAPRTTYVPGIPNQYAKPLSDWDPFRDSESR